MKRKKKMTNVEIVEALRCCVTTACSGCPIDNGNPMSIDCMGCMAGAAADLIEKLTDRCARYAEEIAVLQARQKWIPVTEHLPEVPEVQQPEGHADPIGALGCLPFCPVCGSRDMQWDPETDVSTCGHCGYQNAEDARRNREKRERNGEIAR